MSSTNKTYRFFRASRDPQHLSVRRRVLRVGGTTGASKPAGNEPGNARLTGAVIVGDNTVASTGLLALMQARYTGLPVSLCEDVREAHRQTVRTPGRIVIVLLCLRPPGLMARLRGLLWLRRRTRRQPWLLLYDSLNETLPARLSGIQVLPLSTPLVGIQRTLDQMLQRCPPVAMRLWPLTYRQWAVLRLLAHGYSPCEVAVLLGITDKTVSIHRMNTLRRLGLLRHHERLLFCVVRAMFSERTLADEGFTRQVGRVSRHEKHCESGSDQPKSG